MASTRTRQQAYEDIFARPVPTYQPGPPPDRRQSPQPPQHHQLQMTPATTTAPPPTAYYDAYQPVFERRTSAGSMAPSIHAPAYYNNAPYPPPQAGPSRQSYYPQQQLYPERSPTFGSTHTTPPERDRERDRESMYSLASQQRRTSSVAPDLTRDPQLAAYFSSPNPNEEGYSPQPETEGGSEWEHFTQDAPREDGGYPNGPRRGSVESDRNSFYGDAPRPTRPEGPRPLPSISRGPSMMQHGGGYPGGPPPVQRPYSTYDPYAGHYGHPLQPRKSSESVRISPTQHRPPSMYDQRSFSLSAAPSSASSHYPFPQPASSPRPPPAQIVLSKRQPMVYPALLSRVAEVFRARICLGEHGKDGLSYSNSFEGRHAVDVISYIIKTTDRNLALLLGRALDAQKFFHDVTWEHRLRDSQVEVYQFRERLTSAFAVADDAAVSPIDAPGYGQPQRRPSITETMLSDETSMPSGVFTLLTDCYSPTCTRDRLCYSIACPRRLEQQARLKLKPQPGLKRTTSSETLDDDVIGYRRGGEAQLWSQTVSKEVLDATDEKEKRRQEAINELVYTEVDFVRDLEYLRDTWIAGIKKADFFPSHAERDSFIETVFWNILDVHQVNVKLCDQLTKRQKHYVGRAVERIGDVLAENVHNFDPFVQYGAHQLFAKHTFEEEKVKNPAFAKFVEDLERAPESRKLELNGYLTKPTTRLARYPLLIEAILKVTPDDHPDKTTLPKTVTTIKRFLTRVNEETGRSENRFNLAMLDQQLVFKQADTFVDLKLRESNRELVFKGGLRKRGGANSESAELQVFLFDHAVLMVKQKANAKADQYKVFRKPIPLELLIVTTLEDANSRPGTARPKSLMSRTSTASTKLTTSSGPTIPLLQSGGNKNGFGMIFTHLGRRGYSLTLWSPSEAGRKKWLEKIDERQNMLRERSLIFDTLVLSDGYFVGNNKVTCAAPFDQGDRLVFGTDNGVYLADLRSQRAPIKVISTPAVTQVDVLEEQGILIVLADKAIQTFYVDALDPSDAVGAAKRARKISSGANFFKVGYCMNRLLVCIVKSGSVSSTIKALEPIEQHKGSKKQPVIRKLLQSSQDSLRVFKEFYLPHPADSIHFLKSKLCVGGSKGFEIVDLESLDTQGLLDPSDSKLDFVQKRDNCRPLAIFRIDADFLLCYQDFAFYVNKNGWRAKQDWIVYWEGYPSAFAFQYPYVLAFEPTFIEVRHVDSGALMQIIPGSGCRHLFSDTPASTSSASFMPSPQPYYNGGQAFGNGNRFGPPGPRPSLRASASNISATRSQIIWAADNGGTICRLKIAPNLLPLPQVLPPPPMHPPHMSPVPPHHLQQPHPHALPPQYQY